MMKFSGSMLITTPARHLSLPAVTHYLLWDAASGRGDEMQKNDIADVWSGKWNRGAPGA